MAGSLVLAAASAAIGAVSVSVIEPAERPHCDARALPVVDLHGSALDQAAARAIPSIIRLDTDASRPSTVGSGIVLTADGLILTSSHVLPARTRTTGPDPLVATFADGRTVPLTIVGTDPVTDVAVVRAEHVSGLSPITLGSSTALRVGQTVAAVGSPLGLESSVTRGVISALHRAVPLLVDSNGRTTVLDTIQTDAATTFGSSGGALIDTNGRLVGLNSLIALPGVGFALPVDPVMRIANELISSGTAAHAWLGVQVKTTSSGTRGAVVIATSPRSPAAAAGLYPGTVITNIDGRVITNAETLVAAIMSKAPGDIVATGYVDSAGTRRTLDTVLDSDLTARTATDTPGNPPGISALGQGMSRRQPPWSA